MELSLEVAWQPPNIRGSAPPVLHSPHEEVSPGGAELHFWCQFSSRRWEEAGFALQCLLALTASWGCYLQKFVVTVQGGLRDICL